MCKQKITERHSERALSRDDAAPCWKDVKESPTKDAIQKALDAVPV